MLRIFLSITLFISTFSLYGYARDVQPKAPAKFKSDVKNLSTQVDFNDQVVGGKYQSPMEALSVVEDEKSIDDLIGVRKNFNDREQRSRSMR